MPDPPCPTASPRVPPYRGDADAVGGWGMSRAQFIKSIALGDVFERDGAIFVLPKLTEDMPTDLKDALAIRREATISGRCKCGAALSIATAAGGFASAVMNHEQDCPASDRNIHALLARTKEDRR